MTMNTHPVTGKGVGEKKQTTSKLGQQNRSSQPTYNNADERFLNKSRSFGGAWLRKVHLNGAWLRKVHLKKEDHKRSDRILSAPLETRVSPAEKFARCLRGLLEPSSCSRSPVSRSG